MAEKFWFSMRVFFLGLSVVMVVLFALYVLTYLFNRLSGRVAKQEEKDLHRPAPQEGLSPQAAAAIAAAISAYRGIAPGQAGPARRRIDLLDRGASRWAHAGRKALLENSLRLEISRRKRT